MVGDAPTHWPFTSHSACSIFNVSQLTAAHWVISQECYTCNHSSLANTCSGCAFVRSRGGALTVAVNETGVAAAAGAVSVFHGQATCPVEPTGLLCHLGQPVHLPHFPGAHEAQPESGGRSGDQQASLAVVHQRDGHSGVSAAGPPAHLSG